MRQEFLHIVSHSDFTGRDRIVYRFFEMVPGLLAWGTIAGVILLSWLWPLGVAIFIILFSIYWVIRTFYLLVHLRVNWGRIRRFQKTDWEKRMRNLKWDGLWQLVLLPAYHEPYDVIRETLEHLKEARWPRQRFIVVLALEERAGAEIEKQAERLREEFKDSFRFFEVTKHPANLSGEIPGKGSNSSWALAQVRRDIIDKEAIPYEDILVSAFDVDTQVFPDYFYCLAYHFLTAEKPHRSSYQPVPLYNNNMWDASFLSRVVASSNTFWQMMEQERPERLVTFSSHSMSFKMLVEVGYWQKNIVSEDSRIFWNSLLHYDGDYRVVPLSYPVSMDVNVGAGFWQTAKQVYRQQRRWMWGVENIPYIMFCFWKNKKIPGRQKAHYIFAQLEGFWSLATNPLLLFAVGWMPLLLGGQEFNNTLLSYNLPRTLQILMTLALGGLLVLVPISWSFLPKRPAGRSMFGSLLMILQWAFIPITIILFGSIPGIEAQTRLMLNKPLGFWVTPKHRNPGS
ncbi:MAG: glycosyltransferase family 2 protein [bacterium]|nr:glycosyltransferase family 2 protein [bacterium]